MAELDIELAAYQSRLFELEAHHMGEWVLFRGGQLIGTFLSFDDAAREAVRRFGRGPYLIRQIGAPPLTLPICVARRADGDGSKVRI